jgi:hypothetical protein
MRINRQIYYECASIVYSEKLFHFVGTAYLPVLEFFRRLSPEARGLVRKVRLTLLSPGVEGAIGFTTGGGQTASESSMKIMTQGYMKTKRGRGIERLCREIHDQLPGLEVLKMDPWVWM